MLLKLMSCLLCFYLTLNQKFCLRCKTPLFLLQFEWLIMKQHYFFLSFLFMLVFYMKQWSSCICRIWHLTLGFSQDLWHNIPCRAKGIHSKVGKNLFFFFNLVNLTNRRLGWRQIFSLRKCFFKLGNPIQLWPFCKQKVWSGSIFSLFWMFWQLP